MDILKFGGTSVGSASNIEKVISILSKKSANGPVVAVVSAVGGITDRLLEAADLAVKGDDQFKSVLREIRSKHHDITRDLSSDPEAVSETLNQILDKLENLLEGIFLINELSPKTTDKLLSYGERLSSNLIYAIIAERDIDCVLKPAEELIVTDNNYTNASVLFQDTNSNINSFFSKQKKAITLIPGFVSRSKDGVQTTLGRGGSDYTAAIIAAAMQAESLEIWTDVSGMYTANPKLVKQAYPIEELSYREAVELSHFGAKVLYPPTVQPVMQKNIPIIIKNTLQPDAPGTRISSNPRNGNGRVVKGISHVENIALLTLEGSGMIGIPGFSRKLFETLANEKINVVLITQASSEHSICFGIDSSLAGKAKEVIDATFENEIALHKINPIFVEDNLAIVAVVGDKMKNRQGISGKTFSALGKNNVNIRAIAQGASELNISAVIDKSDVKKALNTLHERFFETKSKQLNLFVAGLGNVGSKLIEQIYQQKKYVKNQLGFNIRIIGMTNSRTMFFDDGGIELSKWKTDLASGEKTSIRKFVDRVKEMNLRNSVFIDVTANNDIAEIYDEFLSNNIGVIACNKVACSSDFEHYRNLKNLSRNYNAPFLFETNVGAGLPVIDTLNHLITSGDRIRSIQAVLSGSLNFIFNNFDSQSSFHDIVKQAQDEGYTEPDPRIDLSGVDVARKILILARESGAQMNLEEVEINGFLTDSAMNAKSVDDFYSTLKSDEAHYQAILKSASEKKCKLKFVAEFNMDGASVGLKEIAVDHPFYNLEGKDNIVMFYTDRYSDQPMIIKGAGAGAEVTASGLFADIIRISNQ